MEERKIRFADMLAYMLRRLGIILIIMAICVAAGLLYWLIYPKGESSAERNEEIASLEEEIVKKQTERDREQEYLDESILMHLNPYDVSEAVEVLQLDDLDGEELEKDYSWDENPTAVVLKKLQNRYLLLYKNTDLSKEECFAFLGTVSDKYIREILSIEKLDDGALSIIAWGKDENDSLELAKAAERFLLSVKPQVTNTICGHSFREFAFSNKSIILESIEDERRSREENIEDYESEIQGLKSEISKKEKMTERKDFQVKYLIVAAGVGCFLSIAFLALSCVLTNRLYSSHSGEINFGISFLGSLREKQSCVKRLAERLSRERSWANTEEAEKYLLERLRYLAPNGKRIVFVCGPDKQNLRELLEGYVLKLEEAGLKATAFGNPARDSVALRELSGEDCVVLAERVDLTGISDMRDTVKAIKAAGAEAAGFILI